MEISVLLGFLSHKLIFFLILFSPIVESPFFWFPYWQVKIKQLKLCCKDFLKKKKTNKKTEQHNPYIHVGEIHNNCLFLSLVVNPKIPRHKVSDLSI